MKIEAWKENYAAHLPDWLEAIGEMDAYCSLACLRIIIPDMCSPKLHPNHLRGGRSIGSSIDESK